MMHAANIECAHKPLMPDFTDLTAVRNKAKAVNVTPDFQGRWECGKEFGKFYYEDALEYLQTTFSIASRHWDVTQLHSFIRRSSQRGQGC